MKIPTWRYCMGFSVTKLFKITESADNASWLKSIAVFSDEKNIFSFTYFLFLFLESYSWVLQQRYETWKNRGRHVVSYHMDIRKGPTRKREEVFVERSIFTTIISALRDVQDDVDNS